LSYNSWRSKYWARKVRLLQGSEKSFGRLLSELRRAVYIPDEVSAQFRSYLDGLLGFYSNGFEALLEKEALAAVKFELAGNTLLGRTFIDKASLAGLSSKSVEINAKDTVVTLLNRRLPSGMTISDRVWELRTYSNDIEVIIKNGLRNKLSIETISKQLDGFIKPGRHVTTLTPYGRALNFDSMRIARTEVMEAYRLADVAAMRRSPWVTGLKWELSGGHTDLCECDELDGQVFTEADVPMAPHPQCACALIPEVMSGEEWDTALTEYTETGIDDYGIGSWLAA